MADDDKVVLLNPKARALIDELSGELRQEGRAALLIYQTPDGGAHYRRLGFDGIAGHFTLLGIMDWVRSRILKAQYLDQ